MRKKRKIHKKTAEPLECGRNVVLSSSTSGSALDWSPRVDQGNSWVGWMGAHISGAMSQLFPNP